jgi:hypothetical protein
MMLQSLLLFALNFLDAGLTLFWTRMGLAKEGNQLMCYLLELGPGPFLLFKISVGSFAALCFYRWGHLPAAQLGLRVALSVYLVIFAIHIAVGAMAFGAHEWLGL